MQIHGSLVKIGPGECRCPQPPHTARKPDADRPESYGTSDYQLSERPFPQSWAVVARKTFLKQFWMLLWQKNKKLPHKASGQNEGYKMAELAEGVSSSTSNSKRELIR